MRPPVDFNLARAPFLATRRVDAFILVLFVATAGLSWFNATSWFRERQGVTGVDSIPAQQDEIRRLEADIEGARKALGASVTPEARLEAEQVNTLIVQRTFSWIRMLDRLETALPEDVALTHVSPSVDGDAGTVGLGLRGVARTPEGMLRFIEGLWADPAFSNPFPKSDRDQEVTMNPDGREFVLGVTYHPDRAEANPKPERRPAPRRPSAAPPSAFAPAVVARPPAVLAPPQPAPAERAIPDPSVPPPTVRAAAPPVPPPVVPGASVPGKVFVSPAAAGRLGATPGDDGTRGVDRRIPRRARTVEPPPDVPRPEESDDAGGEQ